MGLGKSIGRFFRSIGAFFTGSLNDASEKLDKQAKVVKAKYDDIIADKIKNIHEYKQAVAGLIAQQEKKMSMIKTLTGEVEQLENLKTGAAAKAKQVVDALKETGKSSEEIHKDPEYIKCSSAFSNFTATLAEKQERIVEFESAVAEYQGSISNHKIQLQELLRNVDELKDEKHEAVADLLTAKEEREIGDMLSGISVDKHDEELTRLRDMRQRAKAESRISKEMAGVDTKSQEAEFLEYARNEVSNEEFDALIGLDDGSVSDAPESAASESDTKLPE